MLYHQSEYERLFADADTNKDGFIEYRDIVKIIKEIQMDFPESVIKSCFDQAKARKKIAPLDKMNLPEFLEVMGYIAAYGMFKQRFRGPILHAKLTSSMVHFMNSPRFQRWLYEQFFYETDTNNDGFITYEEFLVTLRKYNMEYLSTTVRIEFRRHNTRGDGFMDLVEFMIAMGFPPLTDHKPIERPKPAPKVEAAPPKKVKKPKFQLGASLLRQIFDSMDTDNSGTLAKDELRQVFVQMGQEMSDEDLEAMIKANDKTGDGHLTFEEFVNSVYPTVKEVEASDDEE